MPAGSSGHATPPQPPTPTLGAGTPPAAPAGCSPVLSLPQLYPPLQLPPPATSRCLPGMGPAVFLRHLQMCMKDPGPGVKTANRARERAALPAQPWPSCGVCRALRVRAWPPALRQMLSRASFSDEAVEAQRGSATHPRSHSNR